MHNDNHICLHCRKSFKKNAVCPECGRNLIRISHTWRVPKHKDVAGWKKFEKIITARYAMGSSYTKMQMKEIEQEDRLKDENRKLQRD